MRTKRKITIVGKVKRKVELVDRPKRRIDPAILGAALGAEPVESLPEGADLIDLAERGTRILARKRKAKGGKRAD